MTTGLVLALAAAAAMVVLGGLWWRRVSARRALPCPPWLVPLLENPYVEALAGARTLLDRARVRSGMKVLDVGSGPGRLTLPAAERVGAAGRVVALDLQPVMLERLERRLAARGLEQVETVLGGAGEGRVARGGFDRAFLVTVLGEIVDKRRALQEIHDLLEPGGLLSVTEVFPDPHYQSRRSVRELAGAVGLREQEAFGSWLAFTLNFRKEDVEPGRVEPVGEEARSGAGP